MGRGLGERVWRRVGVAVLALAVGLGACHRQNVTTGRARAPGASPVVRNAGSGLEVWSWVVADRRVQPSAPPGEQPAPPPALRIIDRRIDLETLLTPYLDRPVPIPDELRQRWWKAGFRIIAMPMEDLEPLQDRMRLVGQVQRQWLGELTEWTDVIRGPYLDSRRPAALDDGTMLLGPGRLRLMTRCWSAPVSGEGGAILPALRLELIPELSPPDDPGARWRATAAGATGPQQAVRFERLGAAMTLTRPEALVLIADAPAADWTQSAEPPKPAADPVGPVPGAAPTLGELMLSAPATKTQPRTRAVVVLVPRIPERFNLLP